MSSGVVVVKARILLYPTEKGGREMGIKSDYRPNHVFEYKSGTTEFITTYIGQVLFDREILPLDTPEVVTVRFLKHQNIEDLIHVGRVWWIHEGPRKIGEGKILEIEP